MGFDWYKSNDTDLADTSYTLSTAAGTPSAAIELHAWLNKGSSVGSSEVRYLRLYVEDSGVYKTSGLDVLDRREIECRIIGSQNPDGVPGFSAPTTAWKPIGTRRSFQLPAIYPNCCIELEFRHNPTSEGGQSTPVTFRVKAVIGTNTDGGTVEIPTDVSVVGDLDFGGHGLSNVNLGENVAFAAPWNAGNQDVTNLRIAGNGSLQAEFETNGNRIKGVALPTAGITHELDAAPAGAAWGRPPKSPVRCVATSPVSWNDVAINGGFDVDLYGWAGTGWSWDSGAALHAPGTDLPLVLALDIFAGLRYQIAFTVSGSTGTLTPAIGTVYGTPVAAGAGAVSQEIVADTTGIIDVAFVPSSDFDGSVDSVSIRPMMFGLATIDDETLVDGDRVLLTAEADSAKNGKWIVHETAPWTRHPDCLDSYYVYGGITIWVRKGTSEAKSLWIQTEDIGDIEVDPQTWVKFYQVP